MNIHKAYPFQPAFLMINIKTDITYLKCGLGIRNYPYEYIWYPVFMSNLKKCIC